MVTWNHYRYIKPCTPCFKAMERQKHMTNLPGFLRVKLKHFRVGGGKLYRDFNLNVMEDIYKTEIHLLKVSASSKFY